MTKVTSFVTAIVLVVAMLPATAMAAGGSTCQAYNPQLCNVTTTATPTAVEPTDSTTSTLPFTGLDVAFLVLGGIVLTGAGLVVRIASRRASD